MGDRPHSSSLSARGVAALGFAALALGCPRGPSEPSDAGCPTPGMARIAAGDGTPAFCIDRWEASLVAEQGEVTHSPYEPVGAATVKAVSREGVVPQAYISKLEADDACRRARKRLCTASEWERACRGSSVTVYPYGNAHRDGYCNDAGTAPLRELFPKLGGRVYASGAAMNDPRINQAPETVARTGAFERCRSSFGVYDMVGNLHEWIADTHRGRGVFRGGYYQDASANGDGCAYRTTAHAVSYHDYSTGFRCCANAR